MRRIKEVYDWLDHRFSFQVPIAKSRAASGSRNTASGGTSSQRAHGPSPLALFDVDEFR